MARHYNFQYIQLRLDDFIERHEIPRFLRDILIHKGSVPHIEWQEAYDTLLVHVALSGNTNMTYKKAMVSDKVYIDYDKNPDVPTIVVGEGATVEMK